MSNHINRFYAAVSVLSGHGHIKQRLLKAYEENLAVIEDDDLPIAVQQSFADSPRRGCHSRRAADGG